MFCHRTPADWTVSSLESIDGCRRLSLRAWGARCRSRGPSGAGRRPRSGPDLCVAGGTASEFADPLCYDPNPVRARIIRHHADGLSGLKVASAGFLMAGNQGLALGSDPGDLMLGRLLEDTDWGDVEALVVDLPPGIGCTQQGVLSAAGRVTTILVVTPAEVSHLDTGRALSTLRQVRTPVLGGVENMAYFVCPCCGEKTELHAPAPHERTIWANGVTRLTRLPFRPDAVIDAADLMPALDAVAAHIAA